MLPVTQLDMREGTDAGKGSGRSVVQRSVGEGGRKAGVWWGEARTGDCGADSGIEASRVWKNWGMLAGYQREKLLREVVVGKEAASV